MILGAATPKDPVDIASVAVNWAKWLAAKGNDTISASAWAAADGVAIGGNSYTPTSATALVTGGTQATTGRVANTIDTVGGLRKKVWIEIPVDED